MVLDAAGCYRALVARDARFDGRFFVGVASTGIYCRPVCPARTPGRERCAFFPSAAAAEDAGYRPCLRCRPELAPGWASVDASRRVAYAAAAVIEDGGLNGRGLQAIASRLGVTDRHLRRVFRAEFGVRPVAFAQTQRLLLAKRLLTDTGLAMTEVAAASGFRSLRRFNALFRSRYRLSPTTLRRAAARGSPEGLRFELAYRPPYDWEGVLSFLGARAIPGVESVGGGAYSRSVSIQTRSGPRRGWIRVAHLGGRRALEVTLSPSLSAAIPAVLVRVRRLFDVACRPDEIASVLGPLAAGAPGLRVPGAFDGFEVAVRAVLGQQITVRGARTLAGRLAARLGEEVATPLPEVRVAFPPAARVARASPEELAALGLIRSRAAAVLSLARRCAAGRLRLEPHADVESTIVFLRRIPGVGEWTAQYVAMRALAWPDAFPHGDLGIRRALGETRPGQVLARAEAWRPWRAYAAMHLWRRVQEARR
jgi:AraC family transcriptional regulator of adaptative response / DNA-3-methyladenine glycosylase II